MIPVFVLTTFLVIEIRKSLRDCKGHDVKGNAVRGGSIIGDTRKNSSEMGGEKLGILATKPALAYL